MTVFFWITGVLTYLTVGFFLATIMAVSWATTLLILPALVTLLRRFLFKQRGSEE